METNRYTSQVEFLKKEKEFIDSPQEETVIVVLNRTEAIYCEEGSCNIKYCQENGIPYAKMPQGGGCIIGVSGNIFVNIKRKSLGKESYGDVFTKDFANHLKEIYNLSSVRCDNNDVLVDGFKIASAVETTINGWRYMSFQVSLNQDIETINKVCNKPMVKIPKALKEYGITTSDMLSFIEQYWDNH